MVQTDPVTRQKTEKHLAAFQWMANYAENLVQERKKNPGEDLLSNFITSEIDGEKLLDKEVQLTVTTLLMAGIESMSGFFGMFALNLADMPDVRRALVADPSLVNSDPGKAAWFFKIKIADKGDLAGLMDEIAYKAHTA